MAEEWKFERLERQIDSLQKQFDDAERRSREEKQRRLERQTWWFGAIYWTVFVAAMTTYIVLRATGHLHHH
jgi:ferric-dicitrate binding protein FerR (iron transport regulator)